MARFLASLALLFTALYSSHAHLAVGDVWAQGTGSNLEVCSLPFIYDQT
jgi:hypothetical protein